MLFKVKHKGTGKIYTVYQVVREERRVNSMYFLVYRDNEWVYVHASYFEPYDPTVESI